MIPQEMTKRGDEEEDEAGPDERNRCSHMCLCEETA